MKLQILGTGCPKCVKLTENVKAVIDELGIEAEIEKVTDIQKIMSFGVMMTPTLAIDGEVKIVGKVATIDEINALFS